MKIEAVTAPQSIISEALGPIRATFLGKTRLIDDESRPVLVGAQQAFSRLSSVSPGETGTCPETLERRLVVHRQVHSARVTSAHEAPDDADGLVDVGVGLVLCVVTADCVPILLGDPELRAIGALHAGWRGLAKGIIEVGVAKFSRPEQLTAWIGPSIGPCCYEVSENVASDVQARSRSSNVIQSVPGPRPAFASPLGRATDTRDAHGSTDSERSARAAVREGNAAGRKRPFLDLAGAARAQLRRAGVVRIKTHRVCTQCDERWFSYRREGPGQGRNHAFVWIE